MQNLEIVGIVNAYTMRREQAVKDRQEGKEVREVKLPASIAWKRRVNIDKLFQAKKVIEDALKEIGERYADDEHSTEGENGSRQVKPEYLQDYLKEQGEILVQDTEVKISMIKVGDLGDLELSDADMDTIAFMLED